VCFCISEGMSTGEVPGKYLRQRHEAQVTHNMYSRNFCKKLIYLKLDACQHVTMKVPLQEKLFAPNTGRF
jgi:hypothetical protein